MCERWKLLYVTLQLAQLISRGGRRQLHQFSAELANTYYDWKFTEKASRANCSNEKIEFSTQQLCQYEICSDYNVTLLCCL